MLKMTMVLSFTFIFFSNYFANLLLDNVDDDDDNDDDSNPSQSNELSTGVLKRPAVGFSTREYCQ